MLRFNDVLERLVSYNPHADTDLLKKAYVFSAKVHLGQDAEAGDGSHTLNPNRSL